MIDTISESNKSEMNIPTNPLESNNMPTFGARLKSAREAMNLSEKEAAARLHLKEKIILFIENENFSEGPPAIFLRGYLRSYARLLNFPDAEIKIALDKIDATIPKSKSNTPILHATPINYRERYMKWLTYVIVFTLILLVSVWW